MEHLERRRLRQILRGYDRLTIGVVGDFFLDSYFDCDPALSELSLETGRACHQVVCTRRQAGAAGTVAANLVALGVGRVEAIGYCGDDGEGFELRRAMDQLGLDTSGFLLAADRFTPTYGKPTLVERRGPAGPASGWSVTEELERLDIKNRRPTPRALQDQLIEQLRERLPRWDGLLVVDQVSEANCGVITTRMRDRLTEAAAAEPGRVALVDSRQRIHLFRHLIVKPNQVEAAASMGQPRARSLRAASRHAAALSARTHRPVFLTLSERGMLVSDGGHPRLVPGVPVGGPIDPVGAGDSTSAAIVASLATGASLYEAATIANLVGSITVQQIGTTGTAPPRHILRRFDEVEDGLSTP